MILDTFLEHKVAMPTPISIPIYFIMLINNYYTYNNYIRHFVLNDTKFTLFNA